MTYPKVINWIYKQDKKSEHIEVYYAEDEATENEIKKLGYIPYAYSSKIPGIIKKIAFLNSSDKNYGKLYTEWKANHPETENKYSQITLKDGFNFNGFIYFDVTWFDNNETIEKKLKSCKTPYNFDQYSFIKEELFFDKEFVNTLLTCQPRDKSGYVIKEWQSRILPSLLEGLKIRSKAIYKELLKYDKVKKLDVELACQEGRVRVKLLNKGYVKLDTQFFCGAKYTSYWDGEHIKVVFKDFKKYEYMLIKPTDDVYVTVVDENTLKFD